MYLLISADFEGEGIALLKYMRWAWGDHTDFRLTHHPRGWGLYGDGERDGPGYRAIYATAQAFLAGLKVGKGEDW